MAHYCPICNQYCTCGGDWDDIALGENLNCEHCPNEYYVDDSDFDDNYDDSIPPEDYPIEINE